MRSSVCLLLSSAVFSICCTQPNVPEGQTAAIGVLERTFGEKNLTQFQFKLNADTSGLDSFSLTNDGNHIQVTANSPVALCRGTYSYIKMFSDSISSWSGTRIQSTESPQSVNITQTSPYQYRYYFNVVTHGYSTAYWNWERWEKEIDWMAIHGINMPLIPGAHEAILRRVFLKSGLRPDEIDQYFSGPAHFPWNRMGNLNGWDGPVPESYYQKQIDLTHLMLSRMNELGMTPIVHAFAGFVPKTLTRVYPNVKIRELGWGGGLPIEYNAFLISPHEKLFIELGKSYIEEWEKEFGKGVYYLADSFNEMDVPVSGDEEAIQTELSEYGEAVYNSINTANPHAVWTMQGWTFPFHRDKNGDLFWTPDRLRALVSRVPDERLLILDLANEYNYVFWKIDPSWKMYEGFFGKRWIYSFIPNMGGKTPLNGVLDVYATIPIDALNYDKRNNLVGFGFAPEGVENNEIIYELLSDMGWRTSVIDLNTWLEDYCRQRYGSYPDKMRQAFEWLRKSCFGSFDDHPMHRFQLRPYKKPEGVKRKATVHQSDEFRRGVEAFLSSSQLFSENPLYIFDAIELTCQYLGLVVDSKLIQFLNRTDLDDYGDLDDALELLLFIDRLLASHPNRDFRQWVSYARGWGDTEEEKGYYEANAKRLLTTWGGDPVNDYSGRVWSGLIRDYYVPRWRVYHDKQKEDVDFYLRQWEEDWINTKGVSEITPFEQPLKAAIETFREHQPVSDAKNSELHTKSAIQ